MSDQPKRSRSRASAGGRRTPAQSQGSVATSGFPRTPLFIVVGLVVVVGLVSYLIWQQTQSSSGDNDNAEWAAVEADAAPELPGIYVDLQEIYGGSYGAHGENTTAPHVTRSVSYAEDCSDGDEPICNSNPPAGGPHWGNATCGDTADDSPAFCGPARWGIYRTEWDPETVIHNMEHGGVVVWYNTDDGTIIDELEERLKNRLDSGDLIVLLPYADMEEETIAVTGWTRLEKFSTADYTIERVDDAIDAFERRFNPEGF